MHRNEASVEIERPAAAVFPYLAASDRRLEWMEKLVASRQLEDGELGPGTRFHDVFEDHGRRIELEAEIEAWEPNEAIDIRLAGRGFAGRVSNRLEERDARTRLTIVVETEYESLAARLVAGVITRHAQRQLEADLERLKSLLERD